MSPLQPPAQLDESTTGRHIPALDGIRGLALLLVLMLHLFWSNPVVQGSWMLRALAKIHTLGWTGVDLFFVLSGFLITGILYDTLADKHFFRNFYSRRMLRIFPLYYASLLLVVLIACAAGDHIVWQTLAALLTYTVNLHIALQPPLTNSSWITLNHFWSLAIEEQFYLVWPCLVFFLRTKKKIAIAAGCGVVLSLLARILCVHFGLDRINPYVLYSWTPSHLDGLFLGGLLAMLLRSRLREGLLRYSTMMFPIAVAVVVFFDRVHSLSDEFGDRIGSIWGLLLIPVMFTALLCAALKPGSVVQQIFQHPVLRFFGRYSYGAYVFHYSISEYFAHQRPKVLAMTHSKLLAVAVPAFAALALTMVLAWLSFRLFESKFLALKGRFHAERHDTTLRDAVERGS